MYIADRTSVVCDVQLIIIYPLNPILLIIHARLFYTFADKQQKCHRLPSPPTTSHRLPPLPTTSHRLSPPPTTSHRLPPLPTTSHRLSPPPTASHRFPSPPTSPQRFPPIAASQQTVSSAFQVCSSMRRLLQSTSAAIALPACLPLSHYRAANYIYYSAGFRRLDPWTNRNC